MQFETTPAEPLDPNTELFLDLQRLYKLKQQKAELEKEIAYLNESLASAVDRPVEITALNGERVRASYVSSESMEVDAEKLLSIDLDLYSRLTKRVIDSTAFKKATSEGAIEPEILSQIVSFKPRAGYIKLTQVKEEVSE